MPSKKKKYNARFPPARIKKIMQTDEDVGKVAAAVPVIISRALELFIDSLIEKTATVTREKHAKTLSTSHIKKAIHSEKTFDFLRDLVKNVPDHQVEEEDGGLLASGSGTQEPKPKQVKQRKPKEPSDKGPTTPKVKRGPGRPRKVKAEEKKESSSAGEDSEETETDEEEYGYETAESGNQGQLLSPPAGGVMNPVTSISPGQTPYAQSALQAPQTSSTVTFPGTGSSQLIQPMFQPPQNQAYPMHNIPIPQYPFPMPMAQCNPPQFIPNPSLSGSNDNNNHQFMPPMMSPYMAPFMNMHPPGFMMPPLSSQEGPQYMNMSPATFRQPTGAGQGLNVAPQPQNDGEFNKPCVQTEGSISDYSDNLPLDMSISGKSRSHSFTQPQGPVAQPVNISNQTDTTEFVPSHGNLHQMQPRHRRQHSVSSNDQNMSKNGPISNMNPMQGSVSHYNNVQKHAVKLPSDLNSASTSGVEGKTSVPNDQNEVFDQKSIQYKNLSNLMNKGSAKIDQSEADEDYDT